MALLLEEDEADGRRPVNVGHAQVLEIQEYEPQRPEEADTKDEVEAAKVDA